MLEQLETNIGYKFKNKKLLQEALTHSSYMNEVKKPENNERLEFLGDSVLSVIISKHLFEEFKTIPEGELTKLRANLVCERALFGFAKKINLGDFLNLGKGEDNTGGRQRASILADAFEALIAAIYLDSDLETTKSFVLSFVPNNLDANKTKVISDYKTYFQEIIQQNREEKIEYSLMSESGPDHSKTFEVALLLNSNIIGRGTGKSKKIAEQAAAKEALELMGYET